MVHFFAYVINMDIVVVFHVKSMILRVLSSVHLLLYSEKLYSQHKLSSEGVKGYFCFTSKVVHQIG